MKVHNVIRNHRLFQGYTKPIMELIANGFVRINGKRRRTNRDVILYRDTVEVFLNDQWIQLEHKLPRTVVLVYKPIDYLCTHSDVFDRPIVYDLLPQEFQQLRSAGRLDRDSEGLLVLSDDGYYLFSLTSPKFPCQKVYLVGVEKELPQEFIERAASGNFVIYRDGIEQVLRPAMVHKVPIKVRSEYQFLGLEENLCWYQFTLEEGKYRQIRKMCETVDNPVKRLIRIQHGPHKLTPELYQNRWQVITRR